MGEHLRLLIGNFDGVHRGHQKVVAAARSGQTMGYAGHNYLTLTHGSFSDRKMRPFI